MPAAPLTQTVAEIVELIGHDAALALVERFGGMRLRFTGQWVCEIEATVGEKNAAKLAQYFGNGRVDIERCAALLRSQRIEATLSALATGTNANQAARLAGVTRRTIFQWKADAKHAPDNRQDDLFS